MTEARTTLPVPCPIPHGALGGGRGGGIRGWGGEWAQPPQQASGFVPCCGVFVVFSVLHCLAFLGNFELRDVGFFFIVFFGLVFRVCRALTRVSDSRLRSQ